MTRENKKKSPKKKVCISDFPQCHDTRLALVNGGNVYKMAAESSRARLINHVVEEYLPTGREYTSFFRLSLTRDPKDPSVSLTPPTREPLCNLGSRTTEVYPSTLPTVRWLPEETTSVDSSDVPDDKLKYHCRCQKCTSSKCPSKSRPPEERCLNSRTPISQFTDCQTMTPKYKDAACGNSEGVSYNPGTRDAAVVASVITLREPKVCLEEATSPAPNIIYVKRCDKYPTCGILVDLQNPYENEQRAVRDTDEQRYHCSLPSTPTPAPPHKRCFTPQPEDKAPCEEPRRGWTDVGRQSVTPTSRRMLYNEGITDSETQFLPKKRAPSYHARDRSKERENRCYNIDGYIPFSHTTKSRYHQDCKRSDHWKRACVTMGPESISSSQTAVPFADIRVPVAAHPRKPSCRPRKVLMSEKDIEAYIQCSWKKKKDELFN